MISLRAVSKSYANGFTAVEDLSLEIGEGEIVVLLGASGCGKTTTLKMINQLIVHTKGQIVVDGQDVTSIDPVSLRRRIGYVFQGIGLFPHHSVAANIAAIPRLLGWSREQIDARVDELLELVGLPCEQFRNRQPAALSGGQQQRVGVARALAAKSSILLMDEPFGALDPVTRDTLQRELLAMRDRLGLTILLVTHDVTEAVLLADRVAVMDTGRLVQVDTPGRLFHAPANDAVASLLATPIGSTACFTSRNPALAGVTHDESIRAGRAARPPSRLPVQPPAHDDGGAWNRNLDQPSPGRARTASTFARGTSARYSESSRPSPDWLCSR